MRTVDATSWALEPELWELAARGEASCAPLSNDFLGFWSPVSMETLAAMLMWTHSGLGLSDHFQQPVVDATAAHILSTAVMHGVRASLAQGDERPLRELAIEAHLSATDRLLGNSPYNPELTLDAKYCRDCLWQHLARSATGTPGLEALQWFASPSRRFGCKFHLHSLDAVRGRLKVSTPKLRDSQRALVSLDVFSTFQRYASLVIPRTVRVLFSMLFVTCLVGVTLTSRTPQPGGIPITRPLQQRRGEMYVSVPMTIERPPDRLLPAGGEQTPVPSPSPKKVIFRPQTKLPSDNLASTPGDAQGSSRYPPPAGPLVERTDTHVHVSHKGLWPPTPPPPRIGGGTGPTRPLRKENPFPGVNRTPSAENSSGGGTGSESEMNELAHRLSVQLQGWRKRCAVGGHVLTVSKNRRGLLIDGQQPRLKDINVMRSALRECKG